MTGADLVVSELQLRGVPFIATLCGHGLDRLNLACHGSGMRLVDVRNEQAAGYIAEATGRLSRSVGVCAVSSGVAHVNALTGVCNAFFDGAPMLLITGSGPTRTTGLGHFQDLDQVALAAPICKYAEVITIPERIPQYLNEAFRAALSGTPGPVHLTIPQDILSAEIDEADLALIPDSSSTGPSLSSGDSSSLDRFVSLLRDSSRPVLIAGSGVFYSNGESALAEFAEKFAIPVVVPIWDRGSIPQPIDQFMGVIGAATGGPSLIQDADLIIAAGSNCDYRVGYLQPPAIQKDAKVVSIHADPNRLALGFGAHLAICGDPGSVLRQATSNAEDVQLKSEWLNLARERREAFRDKCLSARKADAGLHALDIIEAVKGVLTEETIVIMDGGNIGQWCHQVLCDRYPGHWLTCGISGVVGYGIPAAMAARLLFPDRPIILISGDGALTFTIAELEAAARQGLGFAIALADDQAWGITLTGHEQAFGQGITAELGPIDYANMATSFGANGIRIENPGEILPALKTGLRANVPTLIHVPVIRGNPRDAQ